MAKGKGRRHRSMLGSMKRKVGSAIGTGVQLVGLAHGLITGLTRAPIDSFTPARVVADYSGYDYTDGSFDQGTAIKSATIIGVTWLVGAGIKYVARH